MPTRSLYKIVSVFAQVKNNFDRDEISLHTFQHLAERQSAAVAKELLPLHHLLGISDTLHPASEQSTPVYTPQTLTPGFGMRDLQTGGVGAGAGGRMLAFPSAFPSSSASSSFVHELVPHADRNGHDSSRHSRSNSMEGSASESLFRSQHELALASDPAASSGGGGGGGGTGVSSSSPFSAPGSGYLQPSDAL